MNKRQRKKAIKKALNSGDPIKIYATTHRDFTRKLRETIRDFEDRIQSDMPNCSPKVQELLERTAGKKEGTEKE